MDLAAVTHSGGLGALQTAERGDLPTAAGRCDAHLVSDIGDGVAICVDLELVARLGREGLVGRRSRRGDAGGRVRVHNKDRLARIPRLGESIKIGEVQAGVPARESEVGTRKVVRHEEILLR